MDIIIKKDWKWYIAEVKWRANLYSFWYTREEAVKELKNVIDMMVDYYSKEMIFQKKVKKLLMSKSYQYAV